MKLILWALLLIVQNMAFTWVSRARNSGSVKYHAIASIHSNGIWYISQFILIGIITTETKTMWDIVKIGVIYTAATTTGAIIMHLVSMKYLEKGKRKVGAS